MRHANQNPYAPPAAEVDQRSSDAKPPDFYLFSACKYFNRMGWAAIIYVAIAVPFALYDLLTYKAPRIGELVGMPAMATAMLLFFTLMIRTAALLPDDFDRLYVRARWLGILAGSFGFPILTIPAFVAVSRLAKFRKMSRDDGTSSEV
ncbi:MAG: hypothetical protein QGG71_25660 [Pirellulaceae bacterium]|jgi:hypothetical protein|nr:hypothetical protein [Pirellulaceae bacterium]